MSKPGSAPMAAYRLTQKAADDLDAIYEYTVVHFGLQQARNYLKRSSPAIPRLGVTSGTGP